VYKYRVIALYFTYHCDQTNFFHLFGIIESLADLSLLCKAQLC